MAIYQDGSFPTGTPVIDINSITYVSNSFDFNSSTSETVNIKDENGEHVGANSALGPGTGSAVLQLAASSTEIPTTAAENATIGVFTFSHDGANVDAFITSVTVNRATAPNPHLVNIAFQKKMN